MVLNQNKQSIKSFRGKVYGATIAQQNALTDVDAVRAKLIETIGGQTQPHSKAILMNF